MSDQMVNQPYQPAEPDAETSSPTDEPTTLGPDAELKEVFASLSPPEAVAWLDENHPGKTFAQVAAEREAPVAPASETVNADDEPESDPLNLENLDEGQIEAMARDAEKRMPNGPARERVHALVEGTIPTSQAGRLDQLKEAVEEAYANGGAPKAVRYPVTGQTTYTAPNGDMVTIALDTFGRRVGEIARVSAAEVAEALAARDGATDEVVDPSQVRREDVAGWSAEKWARFADENPGAAEALRRAESDVLDAQQRELKGRGGIF
jgi:hypothetical protein